MIQFTPEQIQDNWNELIKLIEDTFDGERKENLLFLGLIVSVIVVTGIIASL